MPLLNAEADSMREWSKAEILDVLAYCKDGEVRLYGARSDRHVLVAQVERRPAAYTRRPVGYLSLTELAVSLAQAAQLLADEHVRGRRDLRDMHSLLVDARLRHQVYFSNLDVSFHKPVTGESYVLQVRLLRLLRIGQHIAAKFAFAIDHSCKGRALCSLGSHYPARSAQ